MKATVQGGEAWLLQLDGEERERPVYEPSLLHRIKHHVFSMAKASAFDRDPLTKDRKKRSSTATKDLGASLLGPLFPECVSHE